MSACSVAKRPSVSKKFATCVEAFRGVRLSSPPAEGQTPEGQLSRQWCLVWSAVDAALTPEQRKRRDVLERQLEALPPRKAELGEARYYQELEALMGEIARIYYPAAKP